MRFYNDLLVKAVLLTLVLCNLTTLRALGGDEGAVDPYGGSDEYGGGDAYGGSDEGKGPGGGYGSEGYEGESDSVGGRAPSSTIKSFSSLEELKDLLEVDTKSPYIIGYFDMATHSADKALFEEIAASDPDYNFAVTTERSVLEESKFEGCAIVVYKPSQFVSGKLEKQKARYPSKSVKKETLQKFYRSKSLPLVATIDYASKKRYSVLTVPIVTVYADVDLIKNPKGYQYLANRISKIAKEYLNKAVFVVSDKSENSHELNHYGLPDLKGKKDTGMAIKMGDMHYRSDSLTFSADTLSALVKEYFAGSLVGKVKESDSEPKPRSPARSDSEDDSDSAVVNLTTASFDSVVRDTKADVLLEFYAPWCGHCMSLKPEYKAVASHFKNDPNIVIAAMDATAHDVPKDFSVQGYPTIIFIPGNDKKNVKVYNGERMEKGMINYINEERTTSA